MMAEERLGDGWGGCGAKEKVKGVDSRDAGEQVSSRMKQPAAGLGWYQPPSVEWRVEGRGQLLVVEPMRLYQLLGPRVVGAL